MSHQSHEIDSISDDSPSEIREKKRRYEQSHMDPNWLRQKEACDLWTAAFFQPLQLSEPTITSAAVADCLAGQPVDPRVAASAMLIAERERFFHWPLEFPKVFAEGGFDVILSNPPWERIKLQEQEFFAVRDARIARAATKAARAKLIKELPRTNAPLYQEYVTALHSAAAMSQSLRHGGRFPLSGRGDINTYSVFAELAATAAKPAGRASLVLPKGIATDDTTKYFFGWLVGTGRLIDLVGFENEEYIFPAVDHRVTFCKITLDGGAMSHAQSRIAFYIRRFSQLAEEQRFFFLEKNDFWLVNPNTGNCPIFRTQADAEITKAIYRRVPVLWRDAGNGQPEANPWRLSFNRMFDMANDSHHFRTATELEADGYRREGNIFVSPYDHYLPLYEAKMIHQFDHRFSTYEGATEKQLNVGILPQSSAEQKRHPNFVVQPRYWVREEVVESAIPKYPEPLALALQLRHRPSVQRVLCYWAAGCRLNLDHVESAKILLDFAVPLDIDRTLASWLGRLTADEHAKRFAQDFPLTQNDLEAISAHLKDAPEEIAHKLVERFSPKWLLGWRDITNATNERTLIASAIPRVAVGHKFQLLLPKNPSDARLALLANLDCLCLDYVARQKIGGTSMSYFIIRQLPVLSETRILESERLSKIIISRVLELIYTTHDLAPLARECGYDGPPFVWDETRRFEIRCELDAAFFHLYLPGEANGEWLRASQEWGCVRDETKEELNALKRHFQTPRDAVSYILDQFPIVRQKDKAAHGTYRTKERILEIYDAMQQAQKTGTAYQSNLQSVRDM
jgi:hypothetical protein